MPHEGMQAVRARGRGCERAVTSPYAPISSQWTDYDGDGPWLDYTLSGAAATAVNEYVAGLAQRIVGESENVYFHGDQALDMQIGATDQTPFQVAAGLKERARQGQVGSTRMVSDAAGLPARRVVYTAFGEPVFSEQPAQAGGPTRYLYAGAWGYENLNDAAFPYLHVGERWYDPATGRFLQRDPIGSRGDLNTYAYARSSPMLFIDPLGLATLAWNWRDLTGWIGAGAATGAVTGAAGATPTGPGVGPAALAGAGVGAAAGAAGYTGRQVCLYLYDTGKEVIEFIKEHPPRRPPEPRYPWGNTVFPYGPD